MVLVNFVTFHTREFQDCTKATGLLDYLYWTQTNAEAGAMATAYVFYHSCAPLINLPATNRTRTRTAARTSIGLEWWWAQRFRR
jgi:hypothetical protein